MHFAHIVTNIQLDSLGPIPSTLFQTIYMWPLALIHLCQMIWFLPSSCLLKSHFCLINPHSTPLMFLTTYLFSSFYFYPKPQNIHRHLFSYLIKWTTGMPTSLVFVELALLAVIELYTTPDRTLHILSSSSLITLLLLTQIHISTRRYFLLTCSKT